MTLIPLGQEGHAKEGEDDDDLEEKTAAKTITFELNDTLFAEAEIDPACEVVYLWLGVSKIFCTGPMQFR